MVVKRSARHERTQAISQARALILTGPDDLRSRFAGHRAAALAEAVAALRPRPGDAADYSLRIALRELGQRVQFLDDQVDRLDELIVPLVTARSPGLLGLYGVGPDTAALLLIAAGEHPQRLRSEAAWAHMCAVAPIPASSSKTRRHRLNRGGNREASHALWRIVITRMSARPATRAYVRRRTAEGLSKKEITRCLKRYVAREVYPACAADAKPPGRPGTLFGCRRRAGLRTIRRPPRAPPAAADFRDLIKAHPWSTTA